MFTSRSEFRLLLREDNAVFRLAGYGHQLGLVSDELYSKIIKIKNEIKEGMDVLHNSFLTPSKENNRFLEEMGEGYITDKVSKQIVASRHTFNKEKLLKLAPELSELSDYAIEEILVEAKYFHYIEKQQNQIEKMKNMIKVKIPENFCYDGIAGLSKEVIEKLNLFKPETLFAASEISGITPAAVDILHMQIKIQSKN
jgi:tRNA uridine 5-carboxymethylaminomethyl modification enzyme